MLVEELAEKQLQWKHSGFSVYRGSRVRPGDTEGLERIAQYSIRSPFSLKKMKCYEETKQVVYRSKMNTKTQRNLDISCA